MKNYKRFFGLYSAWDYTREIEVLNKRSENGWQLVKGGIFSSLFKKNNDIRFRYQIDYNPKIDDMGRYIEIFHEQGWEYVNSTWNGWHFFRKIYDPALNGEDFEIYNDSESLKEMQAKWQKLGIFLMIFLTFMAAFEIAVAIWHFTIPGLIISLMMLIEAAVISRGVYVMRNPQRADGHKRHWNGMPTFIAVLFLGLFSSLVLIGIRDDARVNTNAESYAALSATPEKGVNWADVKIKFPDFYEFEVEGTATSPITISLINRDTGDIVDQIRLDPAKATGKKGFKESHNLLLKPGKYSIYGSDFAGGGFTMTMSLD